MQDLPYVLPNIDCVNVKCPRCKGDIRIPTLVFDRRSFYENSYKDLLQHLGQQMIENEMLHKQIEDAKK